jgi:hypothetical protein
MSQSGFWAFDADSKTACVGRRPTFPTAGEARAFERGWWDHQSGAVPIEPYDAYLKGYYAREAEACDKLDTSWDQEAA